MVNLSTAMLNYQRVRGPLGKSWEDGGKFDSFRKGDGKHAKTWWKPFLNGEKLRHAEEMVNRIYKMHEKCILSDSWGK